MARRYAIPGAAMSPPIKRGRGRPRKKPLEIVLEPRPVSELVYKLRTPVEPEEWEIAPLSATTPEIVELTQHIPQPDPEPVTIVAEAAHVEPGIPLDLGEPIDVAALEALLKDLELVAKRRRENALEFFAPYPKQREFFTLGATIDERLLRAGNQLGKSEAGAYEMAVHLTGLYPPWWTGLRFSKPIRAWACGESTKDVREVSQGKLCGPPGVDDDYGTGFIPKHLLIDKSTIRGTTDALDTIQVRHVSGGISRLSFKTYEQGRTKFQGEPVDLIWADEEPPMDIYMEMVTRTTATRGKIYVTFTPMKGKGEVIMRFMDEPSPHRGEIVMTYDDAVACGHFTKEEADRRLASMPAYMRMARAYGIPMQGEGRIHETLEETLNTPQMERDLVPVQWAKGWGIDFGIGHPFAAALCAWDRDYQVFYVLHAFRVKDQSPLQHAAAMKPIARNVPVAWPQDGTQRDKGSGTQLAAHYKREGLLMMPTHATHPDGSLSTEAVIVEMNKWMSEGRFKVATHLTDWYQEYREYHRKDGEIVKVRDDLLSATQKAFMMRRYFRQVALGGEEAIRRRQVIADGVDFDLH